MNKKQMTGITILLVAIFLHVSVLLMLQYYSLSHDGQKLSDMLGIAHTYIVAIVGIGLAAIIAGALIVVRHRPYVPTGQKVTEPRIKIPVTYHLNAAQENAVGKGYVQTLMVDAVPQIGCTLTIDITALFMVWAVHQQLDIAASKPDRAQYSVFANLSYPSDHPWAQGVEEKLLQYGWQKDAV